MNKKVTTQKCRTCLKTSTKTFPLTKPVTGCSSNITYAQILKDCAQFEFNTIHERHLPQYLCFLCCSQLKSTYVFVQQAQQYNVKLVNELSKQFCLREQEIELPQVQVDALVSIKKETSGIPANLVGQDICNFIAIKYSSSHDDNFVTNKSFIKERMLTTNQIIEYDSEDNLHTNKAYIEEPFLTTDQIIEYDFEDSVDMDNNNANTEVNDDDTGDTNSNETFLSTRIESLESQISFQDAIQCAECKKVLASHDKLIRHMRIHHEDSETEQKETPTLKGQTYTCEKCFCIYNNKCEYLKHIKEKHTSNQENNMENSLKKEDETEKKLNCRFCDHVARTYSGLKYHNRFKHPTEYNRLNCKFCSYSIKSFNKYIMLNHIKTEHIELIKTLKANSINNTDGSVILTTNNEMNSNYCTNNLTPSIDEENISDNSDTEQDKEEISDEDYIRNILNMKQKVSTKGLVRRCEDCGKIYTNYKSFLAHKLQVHKRKDEFSLCPYCDKVCKRESGLKFHIRQKHGPEEDKIQPKPRSREKRFMCAECSYTCTTSTVLNIHIRVHHTGERPYKCDICSKSFIRSYDLRIHRYFHTGEKPYKCPICQRSFRDPSHMRKHIRLHSNKNPFTCDDCGKGFTQSYNLSVHKRTHLKGNKLSCSVCGKFFKNKSILNIHQINENHYDEAE